MNSAEIRKKFLSFFKKKNHVIVLSSSLIPNDPSVLLTTAGMQQFKEYYLGKADALKDFGSRNTASIQKSFRTSDIDEVGDETHLTFFEMLGNFSFGGYWKKEAVESAFEFLTKGMGFSKNRLSAAYLRGDKESLTELERFFPRGKIKAAGKKDNFWGPTGDEGPCGPTIELYVDGLEVWNLVFNQHYCRKGGKLVPLDSAGGVLGVDTGMGLERLTAVSKGVTNVFATDLFKPLINLLPSALPARSKRIVADHARSIVFLIADGIRPSNKEAGYVLRRLIRRVITQTRDFKVDDLFEKVTDLYQKYYPELNRKTVISVFSGESERFSRTLDKGLKELSGMKTVNARAAFKLYESFGLPYETIKDLGGKKTTGLTRKDFDKEFRKHQEISRAGLENKFGGHGLILDTGELRAGDKEEIGKVTRLHTATHLLQQALRDVLGKEIKQMGSDINANRTRFDFSFPRKLTVEEINKVEKIVNQKIRENLPVNFKEMLLEKAAETGALYYFKEKYPDLVKVYYIGKSLKTAYSKEFCGGPHVKRTGEIGKFKILKEQSVAAGVRRIRGTAE